MVADPNLVSEADLDAWLASVDTYFLVDVFVAELAARVPGRPARAERWIVIAPGPDCSGWLGPDELRSPQRGRYP